MGWHEEDTEAGVRFAASPASVEGYEGRGVEGAAYRPRAGYLFRDEAGDTLVDYFSDILGFGFSRIQSSWRCPSLQRSLRRACSRASTGPPRAPRRR